MTGPGPTPVSLTATVIALRLQEDDIFSNEIFVIIVERWREPSHDALRLVQRIRRGASAGDACRRARASRRLRAREARGVAGPLACARGEVRPEGRDSPRVRA